MGYEFTQSGQSGLQRVAVAFLLNDAHCFAANHFRSRQIRFAKTKTDVARFGAIGDLTNGTLFYSLQKWWGLKLFQRKLFLHELLCVTCVGSRRIPRQRGTSLAGQPREKARQHSLRCPCVCYRLPQSIFYRGHRLDRATASETSRPRSDG